MITFDQNGLKNDPTSELTLKVKGSKDCNIVYVTLDEKREITGTRVVGISLRGSLLPFQLIYKALING